MYKGGMNLKQTKSEEMRNSKKLVLLAVSKYGPAIKYASIELRNYKDVILAAISNDSDAIENIPTEFRNEKEIAMLAVSQKETLIFCFKRTSK
eukprot:gene9899-2221_t